MNYEDVWRSARRWTSDVLTAAVPSEKGWTVRLEQRNADVDDSRDLAFVEISTPPTLLFARATVPQGDVRYSMGLLVTVLPAPGDTPQEASQRAVAIADVLGRAAQVGLVDSETGASICRPLTMPVYDFDGVAVVGPAAKRRGTTVVSEFAEIMDFSVRPLPDPSDDRLYSIPLTMRLTWWTGGREDEGGPIAVGGVEPTAQGLG